MDFYAECAAVATAAGHAPRPRHGEFARIGFSDTTSTNVPSMLRDLQRGLRVEADHLVGDMLTRAQALGHPALLLRAAMTHLQVYQGEPFTAA